MSNIFDTFNVWDNSMNMKDLIDVSLSIKYVVSKCFVCNIYFSYNLVLLLC